MAFFDARTVAPDAGQLGPIEAGWYNFIAVEAAIVPTRDGAGTTLKTTFSVVDGVCKGRRVYHNFNIKNQNEMAQEIGHKQLSAFCHAVKVLAPEAPEQLLNIPFKGRVKVKAADGNYEAKNEITAFKDVNDVVATAAMSGQSAQPTSRPIVPPVAPVVMPPVAPVPQVPQVAPVAPIAPPLHAPQPWASAPGAAEAPASSGMPPWMAPA